jgi:MoxR-like ATPase
VVKQYTGTGTDFYVADEAVAEMVNLAIAIGRPLLVEGEPGSGKTVLAASIAKELELPPPTKVTVRSTSLAKDLLYRMDALRRLQDAQMPGNKTARKIYPYLSLGPLGRAISEKGRRVVLIDEIDKADIDYPNDLLGVLDTFEFHIDDLPEEEEEECQAEKGFGCRIMSAENDEPIVVITSNREKRLPEPFLRRCLFIEIQFPETEKKLAQIVEKNTRLNATDLDYDLIAVAVDRFRKIREAAINEDARKPPSTSELIDWVQILHWKKVDADTVDRAGAFPPHWKSLFKTAQDRRLYEKHMK